MKRYLRFWLSFVVSVGLMICSMPFAVYADVNDLLISTDSNAVMTLNLDDVDYGISTLSSLGSVNNTVDLSDVRFYVVYNDASAGVNNVTKYFDLKVVGSRGEFSAVLDEGDQIKRMGFSLYSGALPSSGDYVFSFDVGSDFSLDYSSIQYVTIKQVNNASSLSSSGHLTSYCETSSGDIYCPGVDVSLINLYRLTLVFYLDAPYGNAVSGDVAFRFVSSDVSSSVIEMPGPDTSESDYQNQLSSSLSDMSSSFESLSDSMQDQADSIQSVADAIENLQGAMEPHYSNVLTQLHHITEQLHAFWDQQFNLHHVPLMEKLGEIKDAISDMDLEVVVELDELKQTVNNMSQAIQNKLQSVQDGINNKLQSVQDTLTGGYNTGGIDSDQGKLEDSLTEYEEAEKNVIDKVNDSLNDFEFDSGFEEYTNTISTISDFLQALYDSSGGFKVVINLSLMLSLASLVIGFYRFKG